MYYCLLAVGLAISGTAAAAGSEPDSTKITRRIEYQDQNGHWLAGAAGAAYRVETIQIDSLRSIEKTYYLPSGKLLSFEAFLNRRPRVRHGAYMEYYSSGKMRLQESYVLGQVQGQRLTYYPTGVLRRREQVAPGQPTTGECFGSDGQVVRYFPYQQLPVYPGGTEVLLRELQRNMKYPHGALLAHVEGVVVVRFLVTAEGRVKDIRPDPLPANTDTDLKHVYGFLQEEAVQAVRKLKLFVPGRLEGELAETVYSAPVTFRLR